jgi:hypothetical protein
MNIKKKFYDFLQKSLGAKAEDFLSDLKVVLKGQFNFSFTPKGLKFWFGPLNMDNSAYLVIVDKSTNKDITKIRLPLQGHISPKGKIKLPIEVKIDLAETKRGTNEKNK